MGQPVTPLRYDAASHRRERLLQRLRTDGHVSVSAVSQELDVSPMTIRRDLRRLVDDELVTLVHGGARLADRTVGSPAFVARSHVNAEPKRRIGERIAAMIAESETVAFDAGTTALEAARSLPETFSGYVVTNSVPVITTMLPRTGTRLITVGGEVSHESQAMMGSSSAEFIRQLRVDTFVMGAASIDSSGVYVRSDIELGVKAAFLSIANRVLLACDVSKEAARATIRVAGLEKIDTVVTDGELSADLAAAMRTNGTRVVVA